MKFTGLHWLGLTTLILITLVILVTLDATVAIVFSLTFIGQVLLIVSVIRILKDDYTSDKTFNDFYEDRPDLGE
ncbi:MAG: hypothetical protein ACWA5P_06710 [bacterium]